MELNNDDKLTHSKQELRYARQGNDLNDKQSVSETIDKTVTSHRFPKFIRLFVLRRILARCIDNINDGTIRELIAGTDCDNNIKHKMETKMKQLFAKGICKYMYMKRRAYYDCHKDSQDAHIIELIYNKIIFAKFGKEYQDITQCKGLNNDNNFQSQVFNVNDIMCLILSFLDFKSLISTSKVSSHLLYHSFDPNSIWEADLTKLIVKSCLWDVMDIRFRNDWPKKYAQRQWQRFVNTKSIIITLGEWKWNFMISTSDLLFVGEDYDNVVFYQLSMFSNVEKLVFSCHSFHWPMLEIIMKRCMNKIKHFNVKIQDLESTSHQHDITLNEIKLDEGMYIDVNFAHTIHWTKKCEILKLNDIVITSKWCKNIIENCDCRGIRTLELNYCNCAVTNSNDNGDNINNNDNGDGDKINQLLIQLALKFGNVKKFQLTFGDKSTRDKSLLLFLESFVQNKIFAKNETQVKIFVPPFCMEDKTFYKNINNIMNNNDINCTVYYDIKSFVQEISNFVRGLRPASMAHIWRHSIRTITNGIKKTGTIANSEDKLIKLLSNVTIVKVKQKI